MNVARSLYLVSLYYQRHQVTGANKRFDEMGKQHVASELFDVRVIVPEGEGPDWCPGDRLITVRSYRTFFGRLLSWLSLSIKMLFLPKGILYSDFMPIPILCKLKHCHFQLIHDLRNWTNYARGGLGSFSATFQRWQLRSAHKVVTVSSSSRDDIVEKCDIPTEKLIVSYNGITEDYCRGGASGAPLDFICVATYEKRKNYLNLLKALESLSDEVTACFVGRDLGAFPSVMEYVGASRSMNLKRISFIESIDEKGLIDLYRRAKVLVSPSFLEGFGMPLIEAAACGARIACSDIEVFREIMGESAYYFNPDSVEDIRASIKSALDGEPTVQAFEVGRFRWPAIARELESEFLKCGKEVLSEKV